MMSGLEICYVVNAVGEGSIPADIATAITEHTDHEVTVLTWFDDGHFDGRDVVDVVNVEAPSGTFGIDRRSYRFSTDFLQDFDVVQAHHNHSGTYGKLIARRLDVPTVSREGNTRNGFTLKGRVANGLTNPLADRIVCISQSVYDSFRRWERVLLSDRTVEIVPNGVDLQRIRTAADSSFLSDRRTHEGSVAVGNAAMLYEQKAQDVLIEAVARANEVVDVPIELFIAGDGPERDTLERVAIDCDAADLVHFLGYCSRDDVYAMLGETDLFAMPSRWEGFCVAVAEAMAAGVPCILSDIDTFRELFGEAAIFHPVDDIGTLAARIATLAEDRSQRAALADDGRALVRSTYDIEIVAKRYASLYEEIV